MQALARRKAPAFLLSFAVIGLTTEVSFAIINAAWPLPQMDDLVIRVASGRYSSSDYSAQTGIDLLLGNLVMLTGAMVGALGAGAVLASLQQAFGIVRGVYGCIALLLTVMAAAGSALSGAMAGGFVASSWMGSLATIVAMATGICVYACALIGFRWRERRMKRIEGG